MIKFLLTWLEQSGIIDVFYVLSFLVLASHNLKRGAAHLSNGTSSKYISSHSFRHAFLIIPISVWMFAYDESLEEPVGTCVVLERFSCCILRGFVILPCDFIPPEDLSLTSVPNKYRIESNLDGTVVTSC